MFEDKNSNNKIKLEELGKLGLIDYLTKTIELNHKSSELGVGDDAAIIKNTDEATVVTSEIFVEGVFFNLTYMPLKHLGYKVVIASISNLCAMNVTPTQILVNVAVSNRFNLDAIEELYMGIQLACNKYAIDIIGGDTTSSNKGLVISITSIGQSTIEESIQRNGASENDLIVVTGDLGSAYMGLQILDRERQVFEVNPNNQPDLEPYTYLIQRQIKPEARTDIKQTLKELELKPSSMIDISKGLATELLQLCKENGLGCQLFEDKIPYDPQLISACEEFEMDITTVGLNSGEDYELLFTIKVNDFAKIKANPNFTVIGHMTSEKEGAHLITRANTKIPLKARGWGRLDQHDYSNDN